MQAKVKIGDYFLRDLRQYPLHLIGRVSSHRLGTIVAMGTYTQDPGCDRFVVWSIGDDHSVIRSHRQIAVLDLDSEFLCRSGPGLGPFRELFDVADSLIKS